MNYLVHLSLSYPYPQYLPGNYVFDMLPGEHKKIAHPFLASGIQLHKGIDHYSNNHPALTELNSSLHPFVHKYAPVASDIIADYLLYKVWDRFMEIDYPSFTEWVYRHLTEQLHMFPEKTQSVARSMIEHRWLDQYKSIYGIQQVLNRMNSKLKFEGDLTKVIEPLSRNEKYYLDLFVLFYTDLQQWNLGWINLQNERKS